MKGFAIPKNLRYAFDIFNFQHIDILARVPEKSQAPFFHFFLTTLSLSGLSRFF
jgi:hypothetical protein